jgi:hypothetical protein
MAWVDAVLRDGRKVATSRFSRNRVEDLSAASPKTGTWLENVLIRHDLAEVRADLVVRPKVRRRGNG